VRRRIANGWAIARRETIAAAVRRRRVSGRDALPLPADP
jgi:hypothetical protein